MRRTRAPTRALSVKALLHETNEATAAQVRDYYTRPWAEGNPEAVISEFVCECGDPACIADVRLAVGELGAGPALAPGHGLGGIEECS
ncbi:hypothetical protein BH20ACT21_BH20ACT21_17110 [soil metagenome]